MNGTRRHGGLRLLVLMALVLVAIPAVPATADHAPPPGTPVAGSGTLHGTELVEDQVFLGRPCFAATTHIFGLQGEGTYSGRTAEGQEVVYKAQLVEGQAMYEGPVEVRVQNTEPFYHGPDGTHGGDSSCSIATAGTPIPAIFSIFSAGHVYKLDNTGAQVPCTGKGSWARKGGWDRENWHADWTLDQDCMVVGNAAGTPGQGIAPTYTAHTHRGIHTPCGGGCVDNFKVDYAQHLPPDGLAVSVGGPASAPTGQTVTVTAGVTHDGAPVTGAAVAFSVKGPAASAPPAGTVPSGTDGRASFTFTAAVEGAYTVTASATSLTSATSLEPVSDIHTVRFTVPMPTMTLSGLTRAPTEDPLTVTATIVDENNPVPGDPQHDPVSGVSVDFVVTGAGQATPASGSAITDTAGRASFTFAGDRAGDYSVNASATYLGRELSASHPVHLDVKTLSRVGAIDLPAGELDLTSAVMDPAGRYAYFGGNNGSAQVVKVDLATFERVGAISLPGLQSTASAVIDPAGVYAYFASPGFPRPGRVAKVDLRTFELVGALTLAEGEYDFTSAVIDPAGDYAYFGTNTAPGRVVKVDLNTFQRVGAISFAEGEMQLKSAVVDPAGDYAYFGTNTAPGRVVKVDLNTFQRVGAITLAEGEMQLKSAVIDPAGDFAYFGTAGGMGKLVKVDLSTFRRVGAIEMPANVYNLTSAVIDPAGDYAYFGAAVAAQDDLRFFGYISVKSFAVVAYGVPRADGVLKVDLDAFELTHVLPLAEGEMGLTSAVIDPDGAHAYFGTSPNRGSPFHPADDVPSKVVKLSLTRPPNPALVAENDTGYKTPYATPLSVPAPGVLGNDKDTGDGDPLTAGQASDPAGGSVTLNPDGSFTYTPDVGFSGPDTFTYTASDGMDYSAPATVTVTVGAPPDGVSSVKGNAFGYLSDVSLFGGPTQRRGFGQVTCTAPNTPSGCAPETAETPSVELPATGGNLSDTDPDGATAQYGPATIFSSGRQHVTSQGTTGPGGSVSTSTDIANVNSSGDEVFTAAGLTSTCSASASGVSAKTTITGGTLRTSEGDPNVEGDDTVVTLPAEPAPNTTYEGQLETVGDHFRYVFNEQILNPDGSITVYAAHQYLLGPTAIGDLFIGKSVCGVTSTGTSPPPPPVAKAVADFDGNGTTDRSVFRGGAWYAEGQAPAYLGLDGDVAVPGDFDGNGTTDRAVYRNGAWFTEGQPTVYLGLSGDVPVPADYDGDGTTDRAVYRPSAGAWFIEDRAAVYHGVPGDIPVPGDYDGNGTAEVGVFRPESGGWYVGGQGPVFLGFQGDIPVPGDYDGNGTTDRSVYRNGAWFTHGQAPVYLGLSDDVPVPGRYDTGTTTDRAVWRPAAGAWRLEGQPPVYLGVEGDVPLPLPAAIHGSFF